MSSVNKRFRDQILLLLDATLGIHSSALTLRVTLSPMTVGSNPKINPGKKLPLSACLVSVMKFIKFGWKWANDTGLNPTEVSRNIKAVIERKLSGTKWSIVQLSLYQGSWLPIYWPQVWVSFSECNKSNSCSTVVGHMPRDPDVVGSNIGQVLGFFFYKCSD